MKKMLLVFFCGLLLGLSGCTINFKAKEVELESHAQSRTFELESVEIL